MQFVEKWITDPSGKAIARFLVEDEDRFYGQDISGLNLGPNYLTFGAVFEDANCWLGFLNGGLHYFKDGISQGELGSGGGGPGASTFLALTDTPSSYAGFNNYVVVVNSNATGLTFKNSPTLPTTPVRGDILYHNGSQWVVLLIGGASQILQSDPAQGIPKWVLNAPEWNNILNKPATFAPSAHTHPWSEITATPATFPPSPHTHVWADITDKPATFPPDPHTHTLISLTDTPAGYGAPGQILTTDGVGATTWSSAGSGGATNFLGLDDTPNSYVGQAGLYSRVNLAENALEFFNPTTGALVAPYRWSTGIVAPPASGYVQVNNADPSLATVLWASDTDRTGQAREVWGALRLGDVVALDDENTSDTIVYRIIGTPVDHGTYFDIPVVLRAIRGGHVQGEQISATMIFLGASTFPELLDTPNDYTGQGGQIVMVSTGENGLVFAPLPTGAYDAEYTWVAGAVVVPLDGQAGTDTGVPSTAALLRVALLDRFGNPRPLMSEITIDDKITIIDANSSAEYTFNVTGPSVDQTTYFDIPVVLRSEYLTVIGNCIISMIRVAAKTFLELLDTPATYAGKAGFAAVVNNSENGLEFVDVTGGGGGDLPAGTASGDALFWNGTSWQPSTAVKMTSTTVAFYNGNPVSKPTSVTARAALMTLNAGATLVAEAYADITGKPSTFPPSPHTHDWADITGEPATFPPSAHVHDWADITTGVPATFTPSVHTHVKADITDFAHTHLYADITDPPAIPDTILDLSDVPDFYGDPDWVLTVNNTGDGTEWQPVPATDWAAITNKPATFPPATHTHLWADITDKPATFPPSTHTHAYADITDPPFIPLTFLQLSDTPPAYGTSGQVVAVKPAADGLEFVTLTIPATGFVFAYEAAITADPPAGVVRFNNADPTLATECYVNEIDESGDYMGVYLELVQADDWFILAGTTSATGASFSASGPATYLAGVYTIPILGTVSVQSLTAGNSYRANVQRPSSGTVDWADIANKPATFPPSAHTHVIADITDWPATFPPSAHTHVVADITDFPATMPPSAHTHVKAEITDFAHTHVVADITDFPTTMPPSAHTHDWSEIVTGKPNKSWQIEAAAPAATTPPTMGIVNGKAVITFSGAGQAAYSKTIIPVDVNPTGGILIRIGFATPAGSTATFNVNYAAVGSGESYATAYVANQLTLTPAGADLLTYQDFTLTGIAVGDVVFLELIHGGGDTVQLLSVEGRGLTA